MRHESARVGCDVSIGLADTDACWFTIDEPATDYGADAVACSQVGILLEDKLAICIVAACRLHGDAADGDSNIGAFASEQGLAHVGLQIARSIEKCRQKELMI